MAVSVGAKLNGERCWKLVEAGAVDVLSWEAAVEPAAELAERIDRWATVEEIMRSPAVQESPIGQSQAWVAVLREVVEIASFTDSAILITGETGTGKELVARPAPCTGSTCRQARLRCSRLTTVVPELSGSEFFGHERGALRMQ